MKVVIPKGATSRILTVFIQANNVTTGAGLGSLTSASSIVGGYVREGGTGVALAVDEDVTTEGTYQAPSAAGKVRIGTPANMRTGTYELHFHNDLWATGAETVTITLGGAANMADIAIEVQLSDPVRGLGAPTALPGVAAEGAGGLFTRGSGAGQINQSANGQIDTNPVRLNNVAQSLLDLKDFADDGYDPSTNKVQGVVLTDTVTTYTGNTPQTGDSFARIGATGSGLTTLASQVSVDDLPTNAELATSQAAADDATLAAIAALNNLSAAQVNTEVLDVLNTDTFAEPGQGTPAATTTLAAKIGYLYKAWRNRSTQTSSEYALYADDATTKDQEAVVSDNGTTYERGEVSTGA